MSAAPRRARSRGAGAAGGAAGARHGRCGAAQPGQLASHYAPRLPLRLDAVEVGPDEALLAFGPDPLPGAKATRNLSPVGDPAEAARNLFAMLRELDASGASRIAVMPVPAEGLGLAVRDRLGRAERRGRPETAARRCRSGDVSGAYLGRAFPLSVERLRLSGARTACGPPARRRRS